MKHAYAYCHQSPIYWCWQCSVVSGGFCICSSCPAFASIFLTRESWKPLCEIFFPKREERKMFRITRSNRWKNSLFAQSVCNNWWNSCWPSCLPYPLNLCDTYNPHNEWFYRLAYLWQNLTSNCEMWMLICMWISLLLCPQYRDQITSFSYCNVSLFA